MIDVSAETPEGSATLILDQRDAVRWIRLNRPQARNGIDSALRDELSAAFTEADRDRGVRAIVITGTRSLMEGRRPNFTGR